MDQLENQGDIGPDEIGTTTTANRVRNPLGYKRD